MRVLLSVLAVSSLAGCIDAIDPRWTLDHDHVIAARATPPRVKVGQGTFMDALVAHEGGPVTIEDPATAEVANAPAEMARYLVHEDGKWKLYAPDLETLRGVRAAAGVPADEPVPVDVVMTFPHTSQRRGALPPYRVKKTVWLGEGEATNPDVPPVTIDGVALAGDVVEIESGRDTYLAVDAAPGLRVNWLTNVGTLFQDDVATSFVRVLPEDQHDGQLVVVVRDDVGGVGWRVFSMHAK